MRRAFCFLLSAVELRQGSAEQGTLACVLPERAILLALRTPLGWHGPKAGHVGCTLLLQLVVRVLEVLQLLPEGGVKGGQLALQRVVLPPQLLQAGPAGTAGQSKTCKCDCRHLAGLT